MTDLSTIPGVDSLGDRIIRRAVPQDPKMVVFIANTCVDGVKTEPTLIVGRRSMGKGRSFFVPLTSAWQYNELSLIDDKAELAAALLYGPNPSRGECRICADVILRHLPELFGFAPDGPKKAKDIERLLEQHKVRIEDGEGRVLLDASA